MAEEECLHCNINALVDEYIERHADVDLAEVAMKMAESLADLIHVAAKEDQALLLAHAMAHLGDLYAQKGDAGEGGTTH